MTTMDSQGELSPESISEAIRPAMTTLYVTYFRKAAQSSLTGPQLTILTHLSDGEPERVSDIARKEGIRMPTASNSIHQLEERDLVERVRAESDRRGVLVKITDKGRKELTAVGNERTMHFAKMLATLEQDELETVAQMVPIINKMADVYSSEDFE